MSKNALGTLWRIGGIFISLVLIWFVPVCFGVYLLLLISDIDFSFGLSFWVFICVMILRMFYPQNVFSR